MAKIRESPAVCSLALGAKDATRMARSAQEHGISLDFIFGRFEFLLKS